MKKMTYIQSLGAALFIGILMLPACTDKFEEMNKDPNNPVDVPAYTAFTAAIVNSVDHRLGGGWMNHTYFACWSQQWCKIQYIDEDHYLLRTENQNDFFQRPYNDYLMNLKLVIDKTKAGGPEENLGLNAAARVLRAWNFHILTDQFGDVPYSEALLGLENPDNVRPKYDTQESIYKDLIADLKQCNTDLKSLQGVYFGKGDLIYDGNPEAWRRFANSLRLRLLNRAAGVVNVAAKPWDQAEAEITAMLADPDEYPMIESNEDNAKLEYPGELPYRNGTYNTLHTRTDQAISETMVNWLGDREDLRLTVYAQPTSGDPTVYAGSQNGRGSQPTIPNISLLGIKIAYDPAAPLYILVAAETYFHKAEHYLRVGDLPNAKLNYERGIEVSFDQWGLTMAADYVVRPGVDWEAATTDEQRFQLIAEQNWAALFTQGCEAYAEVRRTGYPARIFQYELEATTYPGLGLPVRFAYPPNEESYNGANLQEARVRQNVEASNDGMFSTDGTRSQMWWHVKKNPIPTAKDLQTTFRQIPASSLH